MLASRLHRVLDLTLFEINDDEYLVVACDSDGGIGAKAGDVVQVTAREVGIFALRVPLFEVLACGAVPFLVVDCLSVEMEQYGEAILAAIREYAALAGLTDDVQFTGSTEENVPTIQTGIGVSVLGVVKRDRLRTGTARAGDTVACAGVPKSGPKYQLRTDDPAILSLAELMYLRASTRVNDILPVGSRGVRYEAMQLAASAGLRFEALAQPKVDMHESAGPSTCALFTAAAGDVEALREELSAPVSTIGRVVK